MTRGPGTGGPARSGERHFAGAWAGGIASAAAYGVTPVAAVLAYGDGVSPSVMVTLRSLCGGALILLVAGLTGRLRGLPLPATLGLTLLCGPIFGLQILAYFAAVRSTGAQVAVVLVHIYPVLVLLLVWLIHRRRIGAPVLALCAAMTVGIALVAGSGASAVTATGAMMSMLSAAGYAVYLVLGEGWVRQVGAVTAAGLVTVGTTVTIGVGAIATDQDFGLTSDGWRSVILQGFFLVPVGLGGAFYAVRRLGSVPMSLIGLLEPVVGVLVAAIVLSERLGPAQWLGVAVILTSCSLLPFATRRRRTADQPAPTPNRNTATPTAVDS
ncbi:EamA family transporter [Rhodococcus maanshanensis]|uniref:DMT family transporter n=1 Tax=Rhodococcus maanshanensis TaxID=183556 RepID=UPI0022B4BDF2|nr:EamA family transporter [Rhodococcus maanshanensis]MCZ4556946.1 EamA family transporter [Rhodococcus maanshanensis]